MYGFIGCKQYDSTVVSEMFAAQCLKIFSDIFEMKHHTLYSNTEILK